MNASINQLSFISIIEETLNIKYIGKTLVEAHLFIKNNIDNFKHQQMIDNTDSFNSKY